MLKDSATRLIDPKGKALALADFFVGTIEKGKNNYGPEVECFQRIIGGTGHAWCMSFVLWVLQRIVDRFDLGAHYIYKSEHCLTVWNSTPIECRRKKPARGLIAIWQHGETQQGHTGFVTAVDGDSFYTVEGNTNGEGSRDGDGVYVKKRNIKGSATLKLVGFLDPFEKATEPKLVS